MKNSVIAICWIVLLPLSGYSQEYHKLLRPETYWDIYDVILPEMCYTYISRVYFTNNDTLIIGNLYRISKEYPFLRVNPGPYCPPFVISNESYPTNKFLREDTILKKVYIYVDEWLNPHEDILYDFSLNVGDTLNSYYQTQGDTLICCAIKTITLQNNETRKKFLFKSHWCNDSLFYMESIGGAQGLFRPIYCPFESYGGYFCQSENGVNLWGNNCDYYFVGNENMKDLKISIFPNPAHGYLNIDIPNLKNHLNFCLYTCQGLLLETISLKNGLNSISLNEIIPGSYFYEIRSDNFIKNGKLIIF